MHRDQLAIVTIAGQSSHAIPIEPGVETGLTCFDVPFCSCSGPIACMVSGPLRAEPRPGLGTRR
eukprot:3293425-Pyramimonas_sp.AAC.1